MTEALLMNIMSIGNDKRLLAVALDKRPQFLKKSRLFRED